MKPKTRWIRILSLASTFLVSGCNYRVDKTAGQLIGQTQESKTGAVDFKTVESRIFGPRCISCHSQYSSYSNVKFELTTIVSQIESDRMPKNGPALDAELKMLLKAWVDNGAPEKISEPTTPPTTPLPIESGLQPNYESISLAIISPKCLACHNPQGQAKFLDLSSRFSIFFQRDRLFGAGAGQKLINFEKPDESYLLSVIADPNEPMPPKWSGIAALSVKEIAIIQEWIRLGLP